MLAQLERTTSSPRLKLYSSFGVGRIVSHRRGQAPRCSWNSTWQTWEEVRFQLELNRVGTFDDSVVGNGTESR